MSQAGPNVDSGKRAGDENFPVGSLLIARRLRPHVKAYYTFARAVDDIADNAVLSPETKVARLDAMRAALLGEAFGAVQPETASALALRETLARTGIDPARGTDLIVAFKRDAVTPRTADWAGLLEYCRYSANPVGRFLLDLHGEHAGTHPSSDALCSALQVLNHLQDCQEDLRTLGRSYLPLDWLAEVGETPEGVLRPSASPGMRRVFDRCLDEVDRLNRIAATLPGRIGDRRMRLEAAVIVGLSHRLAARLRRGDPLAGRVKLRKTDLVRSLAGAARQIR